MERLELLGVMIDDVGDAPEDVEGWLSRGGGGGVRDFD